MQSKDLALVLLRLVALLSLLRLPLLLEQPHLSMSSGAAVLVWVVLLGLLWWIAPWLAGKLTPAVPADTPPLQLKPRQLAALCSTVCGLLYLYFALEHAIPAFEMIRIGMQPASSLLLTLLQLGVGLFLLLRPWWLAGIIWPQAQEDAR